MKQALLASLLYALSGMTLSPEPVQNYVPVVIVDSSGLDAPDTIYFLAHGLDACGLPCYLVPGADGVCDYVYPSVTGMPSSSSVAISKSLAELPTTDIGTTDTAYLIYLPINSSSRGYLSIENPMYLATKFNDAPTREVLDIIDSSVTTIQDPNFYTWYQDFEFGLVFNTAGVATGANLATQMFMNLSWVDYFCLPMKLEVQSYSSNAVITGTSTPIGGFDPATSRDTLMTAIQSGLTAGSSTAWPKVVVPYYNNQYSDTTSAGILRILAAKNSIAFGSGGVQFQGASSAATQTYFPSDYIHNSTYGPSASTTYAQQVYTYYTTPSQYLNAQIFPQGGTGTQYSYQISATAGDPDYTLTFTYTGEAPSMGQPSLSSTTLSLLDLTTEDLLSGSLWPFTPSTPLAITNELSKLVSALFSIGQLPLTAAYTATPPVDYDCDPVPGGIQFINNNCGFARISAGSNADSYFQNPFSMGPWYNVYDQSIHAQQIKGSTIAPNQVPNNPDYGLGYGYDYDDLLNMAGLIDPAIQDLYGNPTENGSPALPDAYIVVTLGNLVGTTPLNINNDTYTSSTSYHTSHPSYELIPYTIIVGALSANTTMTVNLIWYDDTLTKNTTPAPASGTTTLANVVVDSSHPFLIQYEYNSVTYTYNINLLRQILTPTSRNQSYSTIDQALMEGVTFTYTAPVPPPHTAAGTITLNLSSVAPPWPG